MWWILPFNGRSLWVQCFGDGQYVLHHRKVFKVEDVFFCHIDMKREKKTVPGEWIIQLPDANPAIRPALVYIQYTNVNQAVLIK